MVQSNQNKIKKEKSLWNQTIPLLPAKFFSKDVLYWISYVYRYWHYHTGEDSVKIYKQAPVRTMRRNYLMFHTMDPVMAIENLKEIYNQ